MLVMMVFMTIHAGIDSNVAAGSDDDNGGNGYQW